MSNAAYGLFSNGHSSQLVQKTWYWSETALLILSDTVYTGHGSIITIKFQLIT